MNVVFLLLFGMSLLFKAAIGAPIGSKDERVVISRDRSFEEIAVKMQPGDWVELATIVPPDYFAVGRLNKGGHDLGWADSAKWDPNTKCIYHYGGGHLAVPALVIYCTDSNQWIRGRLPEWLDFQGSVWDYTNHGYDRNSIDSEKGILYFYRGRELWAYDTRKKIWDRRRLEHGNNYLRDGSEFIPGLGVIIPVSEHRALYYVDDSGVQHEIKGAVNNKKLHSFAEYSNKKDVLLYGGGGDSRDVFVLTRDLATRAVAPSPQPIRTISSGRGGAIVTADPNTGNFLALFADNKLYEYDPEDDEWTYIGESPFEKVPLNRIVGATILDYGVVFYARVLSRNNVRVFLYKHKSP